MQIFKIMHTAIRSFLHFIWIDIIHRLWTIVFIGFLWNRLLLPLGIICSQYLIACLRGIWYGPFGLNQPFLDGVLGPPDPSIRQYPTSPIYISNRTADIIGLVMGMGLGFRNWYELLGMILRGMWYGAYPESLNSKDGMYNQLPGTIYVTFLGRSIGAIFGLGIGIRGIVNTIGLIFQGIIIGSNPGFFHLKDGPLPNLQKGWVGKAGFYFGFFGLGIGLYPIANIIFLIIKGIWFGVYPEMFDGEIRLCCRLNDDNDGNETTTPEYHGIQNPNLKRPWTTIYGRCIGCIAGCCIGIFGICNIIGLIPFAIWYGTLGSYAIPFSVLGPPNHPTNTIIGRYILGTLFGFIIGCRILCDGFFTGVKGFYHFLLLLLKGVWFGSFPHKTHCSDGLFIPPHLPVYRDKLSKVIGPLGGLVTAGIGLRSILNIMTIIPFAFYYGAFGHYFLTFGALGIPRFPPKTKLGQCLGLMCGGIFGLRNYLDVSWGTVFHLYTFVSLIALSIWSSLTKSARFLYFSIILNIRFVTYLLSRGVWYGINPHYFHLKDSIFGPLPDVVYASPVELDIAKVGSLLGLVIGWRCLLQSIFLAFKGLWYGIFPEKVWCQDSLIKDPKGCYTSNQSRYFGILGGGIGLYGIIGYLSLIPVASWYGGLFYTTYVLDGYFSTPRYELKTKIGRIFGLIFGFGFGIRNWLELPYLMGRGMWYGGWPSTFHCVDSLYIHPPPNDVYKSKIGGFFGILFGLVFGLRSTLVWFALLPKVAWYGCAPEFFYFKDGFVRRSIKIWESHISRCYSWIGLIIGFRFLIDFGFMIICASWYGSIPYWFIKDGIFQKPQTQIQSFTGKCFGGLFGLIFGWRCYLDLLLLPFRSMWNGRWGCLYKNGNINSKVPVLLGITSKHSTEDINADHMHAYGPYHESNKSLSNSNVHKDGIKDSVFKWNWWGMGARTIISQSAGSLILGLGIGCAGYFIADAVWSNQFNNGIISLTQFIVEKVIGTFLAFTLGWIVGYLGIKNFLNEQFYTDWVGPKFIKNIWEPFIMPLLEICALLVGLAAVLPFFCLLITLRKGFRSIKYILKALLLLCSIPLGPKPIESSKLIKSILRLSLTIIIWVLIFEFTQSEPLPGLIATACALGGFTFVSFVVKFIPNRQLSDLAQYQDVLRQNLPSLTEHDRNEINNLFKRILYQAKYGKLKSDSMGFLRFWIRDIGFVSSEEKKLKSMYLSFKSGHVIITLPEQSVSLNQIYQNPYHFSMKHLADPILSKSLHGLLTSTPNPGQFETPELLTEYEDAAYGWIVRFVDSDKRAIFLTRLLEIAPSHVITNETESSSNLGKDGPFISVSPSVKYSASGKDVNSGKDADIDFESTYSRRRSSMGSGKIISTISSSSVNSLARSMVGVDSIRRPTISLHHIPSTHTSDTMGPKLSMSLDNRSRILVKESISRNAPTPDPPITSTSDKNRYSIPLKADVSPSISYQPHASSTAAIKQSSIAGFIPPSSLETKNTNLEHESKIDPVTSLDDSIGAAKSIKTCDIKGAERLSFCRENSIGIKSSRAPSVVDSTIIEISKDDGIISQNNLTSTVIEPTNDSINRLNHSINPVDISNMTEETEKAKENMSTKPLDLNDVKAFSQVSRLIPYYNVTPINNNNNVNSTVTDLKEGHHQSQSSTTDYVNNGNGNGNDNNNNNQKTNQSESTSENQDISIIYRSLNHPKMGTIQIANVRAYDGFSKSQTSRLPQKARRISIMEIFQTSQTKKETKSTSTEVESTIDQYRRGEISKSQLSNLFISPKLNATTTTSFQISESTPNFPGTHQDSLQQLQPHHQQQHQQSLFSPSPSSSIQLATRRSFVVSTGKILVGSTSNIKSGENSTSESNNPLVTIISPSPNLTNLNNDTLKKTSSISTIPSMITPSITATFADTSKSSRYMVKRPSFIKEESTMKFLFSDTINSSSMSGSSSRSMSVSDESIPERVTEEKKNKDDVEISKVILSKEPTMEIEIEIEMKSENENENEKIDKVKKIETAGSFSQLFEDEFYQQSPSIRMIPSQSSNHSLTKSLEDSHLESSILSLHDVHYKEPSFTEKDEIMKDD